jgi:hypothetical protein
MKTLKLTGVAIVAALVAAGPAAAKTRLEFESVRVTEPAAVTGKLITRMKTREWSRKCRIGRTVKLYYPTYGSSVLGEDTTDAKGRWSIPFSPPPDVKPERLGVRVLRKAVEVGERTEVCRTDRLRVGQGH